MFDFKIVTIIALVIVIFFMGKCDKDSVNGDKVKVNGQTYTVIKHTTDTLYVPQVKTVYKSGKTIYKEIPIYIDVPGNVDTPLVIKDYYTKNIYKDTLRLTDSLGYVSVTDTIFKNTILGRVWNSHINKMIIRDSIFLVEDPKTQFFIGGNVGYNTNPNFLVVGPTIGIKTKKERFINLGVGVGTNNNFYYQGGIYIKIGRNGSK